MTLKGKGPAQHPNITSTRVKPPLPLCTFLVEHQHDQRRERVTPSHQQRKSRGGEVLPQHLNLIEMSMEHSASETMASHRLLCEQFERLVMVSSPNFGPYADPIAGARRSKCFKFVEHEWVEPEGRVLKTHAVGGVLTIYRFCIQSKSYRMTRKAISPSLLVNTSFRAPGIILPVPPPSSNTTTTLFRAGPHVRKTHEESITSWFPLLEGFLWRWLSSQQYKYIQYFQAKLSTGASPTKKMSQNAVAARPSWDCAHDSSTVSPVKGPEFAAAIHFPSNSDVPVEARFGTEEKNQRIDRRQIPDIARIIQTTRPTFLSLVPHEVSFRPATMPSPAWLSVLDGNLVSISAMLGSIVFRTPGISVEHLNCAHTAFLMYRISYLPAVSQYRLTSSIVVKHGSSILLFVLFFLMKLERGWYLCHDSADITSLSALLTTNAVTSMLLYRTMNEQETGAQTGDFHIHV
ncbi:hypothetical protein EV421DRAFT_2021167 [Armillaria borealis]|uniref:Uncharacterized protein n=1 Tax=Armillaria borealis TaxID=47425 RepID=A0AA39JDE1_9AGAR|nr:hypothetical protein EV421DRAFT_2021167 [Armillaria borealis]